MGIAVRIEQYPTRMPPEWCRVFQVGLCRSIACLPSSFSKSSPLLHSLYMIDLPHERYSFINVHRHQIPKYADNVIIGELFTGDSGSLFRIPVSLTYVRCFESIFSVKGF